LICTLRRSCSSW